MSKLLLSLGLFLVLSGPLHAQYAPQVEVFGGYSYLNVDSNGLLSRQTFNGWESGVSTNFTKMFGVEVDVSGYYKSYGYPSYDENNNPITAHANVTDYSYVAGPRVNVGPAFVHALFGRDSLTGSDQSGSISQDSFAGVFGGGIEWRISRSLSLRPSMDYALSTHGIRGGGRYTQNNFRVGIGLAYAFGGGPRESSAIARPRAAPGAGAALMLGASGYSVTNGFSVTSVRIGSPADNAGIKIGDVITRIDGQVVHSSAEVDAVVGTNVTGSLKVTYLVKGIWQTDGVAKIR